MSDNTTVNKNGRRLLLLALTLIALSPLIWLFWDHIVQTTPSILFAILQIILGIGVLFLYGITGVFIGEFTRLDLHVIRKLKVRAGELMWAAIRIILYAAVTYLMAFILAEGFRRAIRAGMVPMTMIVIGASVIALLGWLMGFAVAKTGTGFEGNRDLKLPACWREIDAAHGVARLMSYPDPTSRARELEAWKSSRADEYALIARMDPALSTAVNRQIRP